jgi:PHD/YefM family antitoxin component YafN of YafNO toxin-antitoxin module
MTLGQKGGLEPVIPARSESIAAAQIISATELRRTLRSVLDDVSSRGVSYVVWHRDHPEAALISYEDYLKFQQVQEAEPEVRMAQLVAKMGELNADFSDEEVEADLSAAD